MLSNLDFEFEHNDMAFPSVFTHKLNGVLENVKALSHVWNASTSTSLTTIKVSSDLYYKHRFYQVNGDVTISIEQNASAVYNRAADIVLILKNEAAAAVSVNAERVPSLSSNIMNLYDANLLNGTGVSIPAGNVLKLTFTFLDGANVVIEGKMSV